MNYFIGIDLGGMSAKAGLLNQEGALLHIDRCETEAKDSPEKTAENLANLVEKIIKDAGASKGDVIAIGIGSPGIIDSQNGTVVRWSNFGWENVPLAELIQTHTGLPVYITNDANAAALGEAQFGSGKNYRNSVMLTLGTGVGGGIIIDGKLEEGFCSAGGELGHMTIHKRGIRCTCGRKGCFECYASATALKRETRKAMKRNPESLMWETSGTLDKVSGRTAFLAAEKGDEAAKIVVKQYIEDLGAGIVNIVNMLRPQVIILGGGVSNEGDNLIVPLKDYVYQNIYAPVDYVPLEIVRASLGNDAGIYGAAAYAQSRKEKS